MAFVSSVLASPLFRLSQLRAAELAASHLSSAHPTSHLSSHPSSHLPSHLSPHLPSHSSPHLPSTDPLGVPPLPLPPRLMQHSLDAFLRGGCVTLAASALAHFATAAAASPAAQSNFIFLLRESKWARQILAVRYAIGAAEALLRTHRAWPPPAGASTADVETAVAAAAPHFAHALTACAAHLFLSDDDLARGVWTRLRRAGGHAQAPLAGVLMLTATRSKYGDGGKGAEGGNGESGNIGARNGRDGASSGGCGKGDRRGNGGTGGDAGTGAMGLRSHPLNSATAAALPTGIAASTPSLSTGIVASASPVLPTGITAAAALAVSAAARARSLLCGRLPTELTQVSPKSLLKK